jgi:hypothetical protein
MPLSPVISRTLAIFSKYFCEVFKEQWFYISLTLPGRIGQLPTLDPHRPVINRYRPNQRNTVIFHV